RHHQRRALSGFHRRLDPARLSDDAPYSAAANGSDPAEARDPRTFWRHVMKRGRNQWGQATVEYALLTAGVIIPLTFGLIYATQILWIWHSVTDFTRDGARYASTHCWQASGDNVQNYMKTHVPLMVDQDQFQNGTAQIDISYSSLDPST